MKNGHFVDVSDIEVAEALEIEFPSAPTKSVEAIGRYKKSLQGIFRVDSSHYDLYVGKSLKIRGKDLPFSPRNRQNASATKSFNAGRREGTLVTIYNAYRLEYREVQNELFDEYFLSRGIEIIKQTQPQLRKGTSVLNNNRYLVVQ